MGIVVIPVEASAGSRDLPIPVQATAPVLTQQATSPVPNVLAVGIRGPVGPRGEVGPGINFLGSLSNTNELPPTAGSGDAYIIQGNIWVWDGSSWANLNALRGDTGPKGDTGAVGPIGPKGDKGDKGDPGIQGEQGLGLNIQGTRASIGDLPSSPFPGEAYLIENILWSWSGNAWVSLGPLRGEQGIQGIQGIQGEQGPQGIQGEKGDTGPQGPQGIPGDSPANAISWQSEAW